jgi:uncharacterized protein
MVTFAAGAHRDAKTLQQALHDRLASLSSAVIALSGGVDSSVVAAVAAKALGARALAVTGVSASLAAGAVDDIASFCRDLGLAHHTVVTHELERPEYVANTPQRCYHCKHELFSQLAAIARERGLAHVVDGTTAEDLHGHRPGHQAALELGVLSPLVDLGANKDDVRAMARHLGLRNAERPASPCLSSRIAYGDTITAERLARVGRAEASLQAMGFAQVRVRLHDTIARVEVPTSELVHLSENAPAIVRELTRLGFVYVTLDLAGLRSGSLLEALVPPPTATA